jgi:serine/threonine protein kinase
MREDAPVQSRQPTSPLRTDVRDYGLAAGDLIGRCLLIEPLGRGGSCAVFRALHQGLNQTVAVKVLRFETNIAPHQAYEQLRTEARLLAQLDHPNIIRILDFEEDPLQPYLVLEMVEGPTLSELIQQSGRLSLDRATEVMGQVVEGLAALWMVGAVHRDVKPGNILLTRCGTAKLADLGTAKLVEQAAGDEPETSDVVAGTAAYLAPEQFLAPATVDHRADIYALGATFYEAVTGRKPFEGSSRADLLMKHARHKPIPPQEVLPALGPRASEVILTMLAKDPDDRYQDADELREALSGLLDREPETTARVVETGPTAVETEPAASTATEAGPVEETAAPKRRAETQAQPGRRSFWQAFLPGLGSGPASNEEWLRLVKRTLKVPPRKEG